MTRDEITVAAFALRYTFGRQTYAFGLVTEYIRQHIKEFEKYDLEKMAEETREAIMWHQELPYWEQQQYLSFAEELMGEAEKRVS